MQIVSNVDLLKDINFLLGKDILNKNYADYGDLLPVSGFYKFASDIAYFLLTFEKKDGFKYEVSMQVSNISKVATVNYEHKIGVASPSTTTTTTTTTASTGRVYTAKVVNDVVRSSYFIPAAVAMSKLPNAYQTSNIVSVATN